jgi:ketosteroid isomerase-like protein
MDYSKADRQSVDQQNEKILIANDRVQDLLDQHRQKWNNEVELLFNVLRSGDVKEFNDLQAKALSLRQRLTEEITTYLNKISKDKRTLDKCIADRVEYYMHGFGMKTTDKQQKDMINRDLAQKQRSMELLEAHVEHLRETRTVCDQIGYAVKNRLGFMAYLT